ncbi:MAG: hypothetical protein ABJV68_31950 [Paracoccaceae bacterium]
MNRAFDATGMGWTVAEDMGRLFGLREDPEGAGIVMAIHFTETWYWLEMPPLKAAFEDDVLSISADADHLSDLRAVKTVRGVPRVPPLREGVKGKKRHGDYAIALALAYYASRMMWREFGYEPVTPNTSRYEEDPGEDDRTSFRMGSLRRSRGIPFEDPTLSIRPAPTVFFKMLLHLTKRIISNFSIKRCVGCNELIQ